MLNNNTICAIATAPGGAIGIIRISGPMAINIADRIFRPVGSTLSLSERKAYTLAFGNIVNAITMLSTRCWYPYSARLIRIPERTL